MTYQSGTPERFAALDGLRGVCAMLVVLFHVPIYHALKDSAAFVNLQACVDVFFVLSGFVLSHAYASRFGSSRDGGFGRFVVKRIARLWPLHAAVLAAFLALELAKFAFGQVNPSFALDAQPFSTGRTPTEFLTGLVFLQSFGLHPDVSWNGPSWSVAVEFYVSILFASLLPLAPALRRIVFAALALFAGIALFAASPDNLFVSADWGVLRCAMGFFLGCVLYDLRVHRPARLSMPATLETLCLIVLIALGLTVTPGPAQYLFPAACAALILVLSFEQGPVSRALRTPVLQKLGLWSYSIYMIHTLLFVVIKTAASFVENRTGLDLVGWHNNEKLVLIGTPTEALLPALVLSVVLVVPAAALTYRFIETPGTKLLNALLRRQPKGPILGSSDSAVPAQA